MAAKKCIDIIKGKKYTGPQNHNKILKYRNGIKIGRNIMLIGVFCPFLWYSILSGKSEELIFLNMIHSGIFVGIGFLIVSISYLVLNFYRKHSIY
jgi:hypothetical protein